MKSTGSNRTKRWSEVAVMFADTRHYSGRFANLILVPGRGYAIKVRFKFKPVESTWGKNCYVCRDMVSSYETTFSSAIEHLTEIECADWSRSIESILNSLQC